MLLMLATSVTGCGQHAALAARALDVRLRDYAIGTSKHLVRAGAVSLSVTNYGPETHELVVVQTDLDPTALPLQPDGLTVDEYSPKLHEITSLEGIRLGQTQRRSIELRPGHYVLFCNLEGHYLGLMYVAIDVTSPERLR